MNAKLLQILKIATGTAVTVVTLGLTAIGTANGLAVASVTTLVKRYENVLLNSRFSPHI